MYSIYTCPIPFDWCPKCGKVVKAANQLGLKYRRKIAWQPRPWRHEVIRLSGQRLVPIITGQDGFVMNESDDIVRYLHQQHGGASATPAR